VYLVIYNLCQFVGFIYVLAVMAIRYSRDGPGIFIFLYITLKYFSLQYKKCMNFKNFIEISLALYVEIYNNEQSCFFRNILLMQHILSDSMKETYDAVGSPFKFIQLLQFLEIMHPLFGYTKSSVLQSFLQIGGRAFVLFFMIDAEPRMQTKPVVFYLFLIWGSIEIVRYPYYITQLLNIEISFLTWLRYTLWIPLYPLGFVCEGIIMLRNIPYFEETQKFTISLPNSYNFALHFPSLIRFYLLFLLLPGSYTLMSRMNQLRSRKLRKSNIKKKYN